MVVCFFVAALIALFPVFLYADIYADPSQNRLWFAVSLYHRVKLFGGYAELRGGGAVFHIAKHKAVFLRFAQISAARKKFEITKGFQLWKLHCIVECGGADSGAGIAVAAAFTAIAGMLFSAMRARSAFLSLKNKALFYHTSRLRISVRTAAVFNGAVLAVALIKKGLEVFLNWMKRKKSTASWKRRRSA